MSSTPSSRNSVRRICSRRPRPSVASIADIFVGSLVLASFCHEHSPRRRGFATISWSPSYRNLQSIRGKGMTSRGQLSQIQPEYSSSRLQLSQPKRLISNGLARTNDDSVEEGGGETNTRLPEEAEEDNDYIPLWVTETADRKPQKQHHKQDSKRDHNHITQSNNESFNPGLELTETDGQFLETPPPYLSPDKERYLSTLTLYRKLLADHDWERAANAVASYQQFNKMTKDVSRDETESRAVAELVTTLWQERNASTQYLFRLYRELPAPGITLLSKRTRGALLRRFANPRDRRWVDARRYLALVEDMVLAGLPVSLSLWSSAIHLAGRANGTVLKKDLIRAIGLWQQMEHVAGVQADEVVFNILFDIAIKAGQFSVANRLEQEMVKRGMGFSRCGKVSKIYYYGMIRDAEGIRRTFDDFVQSGEIVDTVVMNCLIASFLQAGERQTAEQLYARMLEKQQSERNANRNSEDGALVRSGAADLTYNMPEYRQKTKKLGRVLKKSLALKRQYPEYHRALQDSLSLSPDTRTFYTFLRHYAYTSGQLDCFMAVVGDMEKTFKVPPRGIIYLFLFEGFAIHGRKKKQWTPENLRLTWHAYIRALHDSNARLRGLYLNSRKNAWENPLAQTVEIDMEEELPVSDSPDGLYMSLPSADGEPSAAEQPQEGEKKAEHSTTQDPDPEALESGESESIPDEQDDFISHDELDEVFRPRSHSESDPRQHIDRRVENGVFIGRRMITIILRAFGTCCGPKEVLDVWLQLERLWHPQHRRAIDVLAIKEELDKQMSRNPHRKD
ncbi:hypothetical protein N7467_002403 [Penicillium canescens]|nr:hypothetical protein N7467_002403 [Penicillium canescens]